MVALKFSYTVESDHPDKVYLSRVRIPLIIDGANIQ